MLMPCSADGAPACAAEPMLCTAIKHAIVPLEDSVCGGGLQTGSMFIHGGYDGQNTFGDTYVLTTSDWTWRQVVTTGKPSLHTHSHMQHVLLCPYSVPSPKAALYLTGLLKI